MAIDKKLEALQLEANQMARAYYSRLEGELSSIRNYVGNYMDTRKTEGYDLARDSLDSIKEFYRKIPFGSFRGNDNFIQLFAAKEQLEELEEALTAVNGQDNRLLAKRVILLTHTIGIEEELFRKKLRKVLAEIHANPAAEDFRIEGFYENGKIII